MNDLQPSNSTALVGKIESPRPQGVVLSESAQLLQTIMRAAKDKATDMDKLERLLALHEKMVASQKEEDFIGAMARAQAEMVRVATNKRNTQTNSDYADYAAIDRMTRPLYSAEGLSLSFDTEDSPTPDTLRVVCMVSHIHGHTRKYRVDMPADGKGAKGGDVMTKTHATGSALSYGKRYLVQGIFNIAIGKDDDGNAAGANQRKCVSAEEALELEDMAKIAKADTAAFLALMDGATKFAEIWASDYKRAKGMLQQKIRVLEKEGKL